MFFTFHFSLLFPVLFPRCASLLYSPLHYPVVGSKSSSQSLKKWWLRTCAHLPKKNISQKYVIFHFFLWLIYRQYFKAIKKIEKCKCVFFTFHFSLLFPVLFPRCASLLYSPLHYPVVGSKSSSQSLKKWWLRTCAHLRKKKYFTKICDFPFFPSIYIQTVF